MVGSYSCVYHIVYRMLNSLVQYLKHDWVQTNKAFVESVPGISIVCTLVCIVHTYYNEGPGVSCRYAQLLSEHCSGVKCFPESSIYLPSSVELG